MTTKRATELNQAIDEAMQFGFTKQLVMINGKIKKLFSNETFFKKDFAIVKTYRVNFSKGCNGTISYIVLNDCTLGYFLKERKKGRRLRTVEKYSHYEI